MTLVDRANDKRTHFDALHGLRGAAALLVLLGHSQFWWRLKLVPNMYLAVDLFFVLSGFVIAHAYDRRLAHGMRFTEFARARALRLYPLYAFGTALGIVAIGVGLASGFVPGVSRVHLIASTFFSAIGVPTIPALSDHSKTLYPLNSPSWSLLFEALINLLFAGFAVRLSRPRLKIVIVASAAGLIFSAVWFGSLDVGANWSNAVGGVPRVMFSFLAGVYLSRYPVSAPSLPSWTFAILVVILCCVTICPTSAAAQPVFDVLVVLVVWPALIVIASNIKMGGYLKNISHFAGETSYALYVLHMPLVSLIFGAWPLLHVQQNRPSIYLTLPAVIIIAAVVHYAFDVPVRKRFGRKYRQVNEGVSQF